MSAFLGLALILAMVAGYLFFMRLRERLLFLEHEVRWLRAELESLKPREIGSRFELK